MTSIVYSEALKRQLQRFTFSVIYSILRTLGTLNFDFKLEFKPNPTKQTTTQQCSILTVLQYQRSRIIHDKAEREQKVLPLRPRPPLKRLCKNSVIRGNIYNGRKGKNSKCRDRNRCPRCSATYKNSSNCVALTTPGARSNGVSLIVADSA